MTKGISDHSLRSAFGEKVTLLATYPVRRSKIVACSVGMALLVVGCSANVQQSTHEFTKALERGAYDSVAEALSGYCSSVYDKGLWIQRTRIEARREIRQSTKGSRGPSPPDESIEGLDAKTAEGNGPVIRIWCQGEEVPEFIWTEMVRDWRD